MSGKGDTYRPVDREKFNTNWDRIFAAKEDRAIEMSPHDVSVKLWLLKQYEDQSKARASTSVPSTEGLRETFSRKDVTTSQRCPNTIDIEEQIEQDRGTD